MEKKYIPLEPRYIKDQRYETGYSKMIDYKEGNVVITEDQKRYLVVRQNVVIKNPDILYTEELTPKWELFYVDIENHHTVCGKPNNITKIYNSINDLITGCDPIYERTQWVRMTQVEDNILYGLNTEVFKYIGRGTDGSLYLFKSKPIKNTNTTGTGFIIENNMMHQRVDFYMYNNWFRFIKKHKCYNLKDLQEGILTEVELKQEHKDKDTKYNNY